MDYEEKQNSKNAERRQAKRVDANISFQYSASDGFGTDSKKNETGYYDIHELKISQENKSKILTLLDNITNEILEIKNLLGNAAPTTTYKTGEAINISSRGIRFLANELFDEGENLHICILLPVKGNPSLFLKSEVVWTKEYGDSNKFEIGAKFVNMTKENEDTLIKYIFMIEREFIKRKREHIFGSDGTCGKTL